MKVPHHGSSRATPARSEAALWSLGLLAFLACSEREPAGPPPTNEDPATHADGGAADLERNIADFAAAAAEDGFTGSILVAHGDRVVFAEGYGLADERGDAPITPRTAFDTASLSKQFTAAAVLLLEETGRLQLEQTLDEFFEAVPEDKVAITVHQLLTHTSGLVPYAFDGDTVETSRARARELAFDSELVRPPGTRYLYSDTGYGLAAQIVEVASGSPFTAYLREHLFRPAGMRDTGFYGQRRWSRVTVARGYVNDEDVGSPAELEAPQWGLLGFGGVVSTVEDLHRWARALREGRVLGQESLERLFTPYVREEPGGDSYYGYGWVLQDVLGVPIAWHDGAAEAHNSFLGLFDDEPQTVLAVLSNRIVESDRGEVFLAAETAAALGAALIQGEF